MQVAALEGHRIWSRTYDSGPNPLLALEMRVLGGLLPRMDGRRVVDVACGTGRWMSYARSRGAKVVGVDLCHEMLVQAVSKPGLAGSVALGSAERLPVADGVADIVLCSFALGYMPLAVMGEMARIAAPGSMVVVSDLHPEAVAAGWTRSFRAGDVVYEMEHAAYSIAEILEAGAGLDLVQQPASVCFGEPERELFFNAGKGHLFAAVAGIPAVWIGIWTRR